MARTFCLLDYETFSEADLKKVGASEYSLHPSTDILCVALRVGTRATLAEAPTLVWVPGSEELSTPGAFPAFYQALMNPEVKLVAHNAFFERVITRNVFATKYMYSKREELQAATATGRRDRWACTAALAATLALPRKLEKVCKVLALPVQKDMGGHRTMLKLSKPRKPSKNDPSTRWNDPEDLKKVVDYCATDVDAETSLFLRLPSLSKEERAVWCLDQVLNDRGFLIDRPLVERVIELVKEEQRSIERKISKLTNGVVTTPTQAVRILAWLEAQGVFLPDLREKTVKDAIASGLVTGPTRRILRYRQQGSRTSTKKYWAFESRSRHDARVRDTLVYHGASTGRWTGSGLQPHNFPRGTVKNSLQAAGYLAKHDLETIRMLYSDPGLVFASCLRNMIIPAKRKRLHVADYASIEARVLFWVADHADGVTAFREDRDLYIEQASRAFGLPPEKIAKDSFERFIGKGLILGCGYGMGFKKFAATCKQQGQDVALTLAKGAVESYRATHRPVVLLWRKLESAAIAAVQNPGKTYAVNHTKWFTADGFLWCELPSGRRLAYYGPEVRFERTDWGGKRATLTHMGVDAKTKQWVRQKTWGGTITENVVQAIARDLLAAAMNRIERRGPWEVAFHVHDEIVGEHDPSLGGSIKEFCDLMARVPAWAAGCPVKVEGWEGMRYKK